MPMRRATSARLSAATPSSVMTRISVVSRQAARIHQRSETGSKRRLHPVTYRSWVDHLYLLVPAVLGDSPRLWASAGVSSQTTRPPRRRDPTSRLGAGPDTVRSRRDLAAVVAELENRR